MCRIPARPSRTSLRGDATFLAWTATPGRLQEAQKGRYLLGRGRRRHVPPCLPLPRGPRAVSVADTAFLTCLPEGSRDGLIATRAVAITRRRWAVAYRGGLSLTAEG